MKSYLQVLLASLLLLVLVSSIADAQVTFGTGKVNIRVGLYGEIRIFTTEGVDTVQHINRISVIAAGNTNQVIDYWNDLDIEVPTELVASPVLSDYEISGSYNNAYSGLPPNFLLEQNVYGWTNQSYCVGKCVITNRETSETPVLAGLDIVQYVDFTWEDDKIFYDATNQLLAQFDIHYIGIKILSEPMTSAQVFMWYTGYQNSDPNYYSWLYEGTFDTDTLITDADGGVGIIGGTSSTLQPAATKTVYFAVSVGGNYGEMLANMQLAQQKYNQIVSVESDFNNIPSDFVLEQNYPNPFNPSTKISFGLPQRSNVALKVFNMLGEEVAELVNESLEAGTHSYNFDASRLTSGVYIYTLQTGSNIISKKMTLIK
ncbi:MAG: T9SS type A sorting domain-containing protein [Ignavibacteria bacterium]|nr:T9SS type A sorting domain-containing protein [Ignavibacteria bacterium]